MVHSRPAQLHEHYRWTDRRAVRQPTVLPMSNDCIVIKIADKAFFAEYEFLPPDPQAPSPIAACLDVALMKVEGVRGGVRNRLAIARRLRVLHLYKKSQPRFRLDSDVQPQAVEIVSVIGVGYEVPAGKSLSAPTDFSSELKPGRDSGISLILTVQRKDNQKTDRGQT